MADREPTPHAQEGAPPPRWVATLSAVVTLVASTGVKLFGAYLVYHEAFLVPEPRTSLVFVGVSFAAGAQALENWVLRALDNLFQQEKVKG